MRYSLSSPPLAAVMVTLFAQGAVAQFPAGKTFKPGYCNVCRDAPNHAVEWRNLTNPSASFQNNGEKWTCGYLQDLVKDVNPHQGTVGEARWCGLAQRLAEMHCSCIGPSIPPPNPPCNLCQGQQFDYVPQVNAGLTVDTDAAGNMNCQDLYNVMAEGIVEKTLCPTIIANAGPKCCGIEEITPGDVDDPNVVDVSNVPTESTCVSKVGLCQYNSDCCAGLECKVKVWNGPKYCLTTSSRKSRKSIVGSNVGGAAGRSRSGGR